MPPTTVFYASVGSELMLYDLDIDGAALHRRATVALPVNVQYAWPHPARNFLYVVSSNGGPGGLAGDTHLASAFRVDPASGALELHGAPRVLPSRPIHASVEAGGDYLLTAYNSPSNVTVHRIARDGSIGELLRQPEPLDTGIYGHQVRTTPSNRAAILVTRGNNAADSRAEDPGALKVFGFKDGVLSNMVVRSRREPGMASGRAISISTPRGHGSMSRSSDRTSFMSTSCNPTAGSRASQCSSRRRWPIPRNVKPSQGAGPIHVHPAGGFVYLTNRNGGLVDFDGRKVSNGGENNVAVFVIDQATGEPMLVQTVEAQGNHLRTFAIDPGGRLLVAASIAPLPVRDGGEVKTLPAALLVYRIGADGKLDLARKYSVETGERMQFWSGMVTLHR